MEMEWAPTLPGGALGSILCTEEPFDLDAWNEDGGHIEEWHEEPLSLDAALTPMDAGLTPMDAALTPMDAGLTLSLIHI